MGVIMNNATEGHCLCGRLAFSFSEQPTWACFCHCNDCRRNCAAPIVAFIGVALEGIEWRVDGVAGTPTRGSQHRKTDYAGSASTELPRVSAMVT